MTDTPSDAAKRKRDELAQQHWHSYRTFADATAEAFALYIDEVDRVAREVQEWAFSDSQRVWNAATSLTLPKPVAPLREICDAAFEATRKMTDNSQGRDKFVEGIRAELDKRGLTIAPKESHDAK